MSFRVIFLFILFIGNLRLKIHERIIEFIYEDNYYLPHSLLKIKII